MWNYQVKCEIAYLGFYSPFLNKYQSFKVIYGEIGPFVQLWKFNFTKIEEKLGVGGGFIVGWLVWPAYANEVSRISM